MITMISCKLILFSCCAGLFALDAEAARTMPKTRVMRYLKQYGYLPSASSDTMTDRMMSKGISEFQAFIGMPATGIMDAETTHMMQMPRCGIKDKFLSRTSRRSRRWARFGRQWRNRNLTYRVTKYSDKQGPIDNKAVDKVIAKAFATWSEHVDLSFTPTSKGQIDMEIKFARRNHGDGQSFDGPQGVLAHAFNPESGGDIHFDDDEEWNDHKISFVAVHEMGHALGLSHSRVKGSIMLPFYDPHRMGFELHKDDIEGIQAQYGKKRKTKTRVEEDPDLCKDFRLDAIFDCPDGYIYGFKVQREARLQDSYRKTKTKTMVVLVLVLFITNPDLAIIGNHYTRMMDDKVSTGYPKLIASRWKELPGNIDAAMTYDGLTYFFKRTMYWAYNGDQKVLGPEKIRERFPGIPDDIDTVTIYTGDGKIYFFKGTKYWKFEPKQRPQVKSLYPRDISDWKGLPKKLDASVAFRGDNYFFAGDKAYRFDDKRSRVYPDSPVKMNGNLFGCQLQNETHTS